MSTLVQRFRALESKIKDLAQAKSLADDLNHIQQRAGEWRTSHTKLNRLRARTAPLGVLIQDAATVASKAEALRQNARKVLSRLMENDGIKEVTRDAAWTRLLNSCDGLAEELDTAGRKAWRIHLEKLGSLEDPNALRLRTPMTPANEEALKDYEFTYREFATLARLELPRSPEDLAEASGHAASCRDSLARITLDLPDEVRRFYGAVQAGTATLAHVTPAVAKWLSEQGQLERFRVRSVGP